MTTQQKTEAFSALNEKIAQSLVRCFILKTLAKCLTLFEMQSAINYQEGLLSLETK